MSSRKIAMDGDRQERQEFAEMPEQVYQDLLRRSKQVSAETALSVGEHREIVRKERAQRKPSKPAALADNFFSL
jgi:hypothetical protein